MEEQFELNKKSELASLSIKDLFYKYIRFLPLFVISVALALLVAYIYLRYATLVYRSSSSMVIRDERAGGGGDDKLDQLLRSDGTKNIQNEIEVLRSRPLMERVVRGLNLNFTYKAIGKIKEVNIYKASPFIVEAFKIKDSSSFTLEVQFENNQTFRVNGEKKLFSFNQVFENSNGVFRLVRNSYAAPGSLFKVHWEPTSTVASDLTGKLVVAPKTGTAILVLTLEHTNALLAADVLNRLMKEYQLQTVEEKNETTSNTLAFVNERLAVVSKEIDSINQRYVSYLRENPDLLDAEAQLGTYIARLTRSDQAQMEQGIQLSVLQQVEAYVSNSANNHNSTPSSLTITDPTLTPLVGAYNQAQLDRKRILQNVPETNPLATQNAEQIETLRNSILENLRNVKRAYSTSSAASAREKGQVQAQIKTLPLKQQNLIEIKRQLAGKEVVRNLLLQNREESAIALASQISNIKILESATVNNFPVKPNKRTAQMLAIFIGLALPALGIFIAELLNDKVGTRHDIERITAATILGEVGHSFTDGTLVVSSNNRSVVAEQFRILRSNLQYVLNHFPKPVILITSSFSGEGKSFVSTNMGAVMSLTGKRTIILEFDIRKPKILSELHIPKKPGLTNYLLGKSAIEELPIQVPGYENLFVLACGPIPPNPAEILLDSKLNDLFIYLRQNFDVVVMDTAPVGMVSDAMTLSKFADCTLYIVRQGHTYKRQIGLIDELYQQSKLPKISLILNDVKIRAGYGYYGYGRYGYGYGYGSGYFEEETTPPTLVDTWLGWVGIKKKKRKGKTVKV